MGALPFQICDEHIKEDTTVVGNVLEFMMYVENGCMEYAYEQRMAAAYIACCEQAVGIWREHCQFIYGADPRQAWAMWDAEELEEALAAGQGIPALTEWVKGVRGKG